MQKKEIEKFYLKRINELIKYDKAYYNYDNPLLLHSSEKYDLVIGSRYKNGVNVINWPMRRLLLSYFANWYARIITGVPVSDLTGGFKCFKTEVLKNIDLNKIASEGYSFQIEINFIVYNMGYKIKEEPIVFHDRTVGESKMNKSIIFEAIILVPKLFIKRLFRLF